jgi:CheY-like chemotaxis protein
MIPVMLFETSSHSTPPEFVEPPQTWKALLPDGQERGLSRLLKCGEAASMATMKVLLAEDDLDLSDALSKVLVSYGFDVLCCADGMEALAMARHHNFDAIVLDLSLPSLDGLDLLRRIRDDGSQAPVLIVTARGAVGEKVLGLDLGADDYVCGRSSGAAKARKSCTAARFAWTVPAAFSSKACVRWSFRPAKPRCSRR